MIKTIECIACGRCQKACATRHAITPVEGGVAVDLDNCFACGHCVAVCPTDAMDNPLSPRQGPVGSLPAPEDMARYLRIPRSVRRYKEELVPREKMTQLIDIGRFAQTGSNRQGISYLVVEGRDKMQELNRMYCREALRLMQEDPSLLWLEGLIKQQDQLGTDNIFRGAPQLILALADKDFDRGRENAQFALTFIALLAPSLGIGTCWGGIPQALMANDAYAAPFLEYCRVPENKRIRGVMMTGLPDIEFRRLVARNPLELDWR